MTDKKLIGIIDDIEIIKFCELARSRHLVLRELIREFFSNSNTEIQNAEYE